MENRRFEYSYSALSKKERAEVENIKKRYEGESITAITYKRLKKIDFHVNFISIFLSTIVCVFGLLIVGLGLSMIWVWNDNVIGSIISLIGSIPTAISYPLYRAILKKARKKYSAEVIHISETLLKETPKPMQTKL